MSQSLYAFLLHGRDVLHARPEHHAAVLGSDLRLPPHFSHIVGIAIGFAFMVAAVGLGLGSVFLAYPVLQTVLKYAGAACLLYLVGTVSTLVWTLFGTALRPVLTSERLVRAFNVLKPILLLASLDPVLVDA